MNSSRYQPRRPHASPFWQLIRNGWEEFLACYETDYRPTLGPLLPSATKTVQAFLRCGDLASGFTRYQCEDCGYEHLLAFTCKSRHFCPSCHQRRVRSTSQWIATSVCYDVPHRQFVFTIPKVLRGIFRKRKKLLTHLFHTAIDTLRDYFRIRLSLPDGKLGAIAALHTFGDYLIFHPHVHVLAADGLFASDGTFHCMPNECLNEATELFRNRFLQCLHKAKLISNKRIANLLSWKHSGFSIHSGGVKPIAQFDRKGRQRLAEYLMRHPFSLQKTTWNSATKTVIYRSKRHYNTKRNFEIFTAPDFIAAALLHLPPKGFQTIRYYGVYSNKTRGQRKGRTNEISLVKSLHEGKDHGLTHNSEVQQVLFIQPPPIASAGSMRPLWRDLIQEIWGADSLICPCCKCVMKKVETF